MIDGVEILPGGWCSRVYGAAERVLKVPFVGEEIVYGSRAAQAISGRTGLDILDHDPDTGALLMRRIRPGGALSDKGLSFPDMRDIFVEMFLALEDVPNADWMTMREYYADSPELQPLAEEFDEAAPSRRFIHGDLHHGNVLESQGGWALIDPKGLFADPHYELVAWLANPIDRLREVPDLAVHLACEIDALCARLSLDPKRVVQWGMLDTRDNKDPGHPWSKLKAVYNRLGQEYGVVSANNPNPTST